MSINGLITFEEFDIMFRALEPSAYNDAKSKKLFAEYADLTDDCTEFLSLGKFAALAAKNHIFSEANQLLFFGGKFDNFEEKSKYVKKNCKSDIEFFKKRLLKVGLFDEKWKNRFEEIGQRSQNSDYPPKCNLY